MQNFPRPKPIAPREPFHQGKPWNDRPLVRTKANYEYQPSRKSPIRTKSMITFVNLNADIEGTQPKPRISKYERETAGLIKTSIQPKRALHCTEKEKADFLKTWTKGPPPLTETHGHAIGKGETREFIRDQIDISVGA